MSIAQHAERILAAWNVADPERFENELDSALNCCRRPFPANGMEREQRELLETVVERLRRDRSLSGSHPRGSAQTLNAGFALLHHLSHRAAA